MKECWIYDRRDRSANRCCRLFFSGGSKSVPPNRCTAIERCGRFGTVSRKDTTRPVLCLSTVFLIVFVIAIFVIVIFVIVIFFIAIFVIIAFVVVTFVVVIIHVVVIFVIVILNTVNFITAIFLACIVIF